MQLELEFDAVPWPAYTLRVCHYCNAEGRRCSWCGALPSECTCEQGLERDDADGAAPLPVPFVRKSHPWWRCDACDGVGVLWASDALGVACRSTRDFG